MSRPVSLNALDRALKAMARSHAALPDFCRQVTQGELWLLVPYHPEVEGETLTLRNGSAFPFLRLQDAEGEIVPVFSSEARVEESLRRANVPPRTYSTGVLPALQVFELLSAVGLRAVINKSYTTGELTLPLNMVRDLADGSALRPLSTNAPRENRIVQILDPSDYPTDLIQPIFEVLRRHRQFRAAWVFGLVTASQPPPTAGVTPDEKKYYHLLILMDPRDAAIFHDFNLVAQSACDDSTEVNLGYLDEQNPAQIADLFRQAPAFYVATDYERPPGAKV